MQPNENLVGKILIYKTGVTMPHGVMDAGRRKSPDWWGLHGSEEERERAVGGSGWKRVGLG
jgi:hypothetical protein